MNPSINSLWTQHCATGSGEKGGTNIAGDLNGSNEIPEGTSPVGPSAVFLHITSRCNLCCPHCWVAASSGRSTGNGQSTDSVLTLADYVRLLERLKQGGLKFVKITGGEPLLEKRLVLGLLGACRRLGLYAGLESNGTLLSPKVVEQLKRLGLKELGISLDFPDPALHDEFRGQTGVFRAAVDAVRSASRIKLNVSVVTSVFATNLPYLRRHAEFTLTEIPAANMKVAGVVGLGRAREMNGGLLGPREYLEMATILRELGRLFPDRIAVGLPWSLVNPMDDPGLSFGSCHADGTMGILPNGGVSLCGLGVSRPEAVVGNVLTRDPLAIWRDAELFVYLRTRWGQEFSGVCGECIFHRYCANVCPAYAFEVYGSFSAPFPPCQHLFEEGLFPEYCLLDSPGGA